MLLALVMTAMTASAYDLTVGTNEHGTLTFKVNENTVTTANEGDVVTVTITPDDGYIVNQPSGQWIAAMAKAPRRAQTGVDLLKDFELTKLLGQDNTWSFVMKRANAEISVSYKKLLTNTDITVQDIAALTYSSVAQEPTVTVKDGSVVLTKDVDYTVAYSNNTNAALSTATENAPTVTITAVATSDKYAGETTKTFTINKKALTVTADNKSVTFGDDAPQYTVSYDGFVNNETKAVLSGTLAFACDYVKDQTAAGNYDITPSGLTSSNYDITFTKGTLTVGKKALEDGFIANIASLVYNGVAQEPAPVVTFNGMTLEKDVDYTVSYENNVNVGTATATVTALANSTKYSGSASKTFAINKAALTVTAEAKTVTYGDEAPTYTVSYDGLVGNETETVLGGTLALACDYVQNQSGVGTYAITPSGLTSSNYDITFTAGTLTVSAKALEDAFIAAIAAVTYNGQAQTPAPVLTFNGMTLVAGTDYTVAYSNNTNVGTATVTVSGTGNYSGTASKTFVINPAGANLFDLTLDPTEYIYDGTAKTPAVTVKDGETVLVEDTDYELAFTNNVNAGTATVTATGKGNYSGTASTTFAINKAALTVTADDKTVTYGDAAPEYTVSYDGLVGNETETVLGGTLALACDYVQNQSGVGTYAITPSGLTSSNYDITFTAGTLTVSAKALEDAFIADIAAVTYNGQAQTPAPVLTFNGMTLVAGTDYTVAYQDNVNVGTANVTATAVAGGNYSGTAQKTFAIQKKALTVTADNKTATYGDAAPEYTVSYDGFMNNETAAVLGGTLSLACDYVKNQSGVGTYAITPSGLTSSNYEITFAEGTLTVSAKALEDGFIANIDALTYNGQAQTPAPVLTFNGMTLAESTDYTVAYSNNTNVGTATVTVSGTGNYSGTASKTFTINPAMLTAATLAETTFVYNQQEQTAEVASVKAGTLTVPATDYTVSGNKATTVGTYTATITGKGNFTGSVTAQFTIVRDMSTVFSEGSSWATYVAQEDLELPEGIEAYAVTGATATEVSAEAISYIPTGVGILLKRSDVTKTDYKGYAYEGVTATIESLLVGSATEATDMTTYKDFVLYRDEFVLSGAASVAAGHAYLPAANATAGAARRSIVVSGGATGISEELRVKSEEFATAAWYDLNGRKLQAAPTKKGIYIRNGKKVVIK